ncbi:MAG: hypothetical protein G01um101431_321 [Parcubacteria group bacterium Gr01-1014_31]|nr:MAG: hypothetical protein G01um101431_321 [Parcubacteria group bacterium Gr01-1014_31]
MSREVEVKCMLYIELKTKGLPAIRFNLYEKEAPVTCDEFIKALPLEANALQARFAGEEIWIKEGPSLNIPQENASINLKVGELGYASPIPGNEVSRSIAIVYGEAKLSDCVNVFGYVYKEDLQNLKKLGEKVWTEGKTILRFELKEV